MKNETIDEIRVLAKQKLREWYVKIANVGIDSLRLNVFLASMMGFENSHDLVNWYFGEHIERSIVTSFGYLIQKIALIVSDGVKFKGKGADIKVRKGRRDYYIEIKSGTASSNVKMMRETSRAQHKLKETHGNHIRTVLGLTYGKKEEVTSFMANYYKGDIILVGEEFWNFLSGEEGTHKVVFDAITAARKEVMKEQAVQSKLFEGVCEAETLSEKMEKRKQLLIEEWNEKYGEELRYENFLKYLF